MKLAYASYQSTNNLSGLPPLVIIHGLFGSKRNWDSLSKAISRKGIKVNMPSLVQNYGISIANIVWNWTNAMNM